MLVTVRTERDISQIPVSVPKVFILVPAKINCGSFGCQCDLRGRGGYFLIRG